MMMVVMAMGERNHEALMLARARRSVNKKAQEPVSALPLTQSI
jgi:hypothetical protein